MGRSQRKLRLHVSRSQSATRWVLGCPLTLMNLCHSNLLEDSLKSDLNHYYARKSKWSSLGISSAGNGKEGEGLVVKWFWEMSTLKQPNTFLFCRTSLHLIKKIPTWNQCSIKYFYQTQPQNKILCWIMISHQMLWEMNKRKSPSAPHGCWDSLSNLSTVYILLE